MVYKPRRERRAKGGKAEAEPLHPEHGHQYNAVGSPEAKEEDAESDGFKRGGMPKKRRKEGGKVEGHGAKHHMGKRARGGATKPHVEMHMGEHHEHHGEHHKEHHGEHEPERRARGGETKHREEEREKRARGGHVSHRARGGTAFSEGRKAVASPSKGSEKANGPGEDAETIP